MRGLLDRYVPNHFRDPLGLAWRLVRSGNPAAWQAMGFSAAGVAALPLDLAMQRAERRALQAAPARTQPLLFICGPPRSGTTLLFQTLIRCLPIGHFNNLSSLFPRSPLTALRRFGRLAGGNRTECQSFYGRTRGLAGSNDALFLWDRWLGADRSRPATELSPGSQEEMRRFFAAAADFFQKPVVCKNNSLNASAHLVSAALPDAIFLCLNRHPLYLAQSLLEARRMIHSDELTPYGVAPPAEPQDNDALRSVCRQVLHYQQLERFQQSRIGADRFWTVSYEEFCQDPGPVVRRVAAVLLPAEAEALEDLQLAPFRASNQRRVDENTFQDLQRAWDEIAAEAADQPSDHQLPA